MNLSKNKFKMKKDPNVYDPAEDTMLLAKNLDVRINDRVLEIGVGSGYISLVASQKAESVFGIDINPHAVRLAKINTKQNNVSNVEFIVSDLFTAINSVIDNGYRSDTGKKSKKDNETQTYNVLLVEDHLINQKLAVTLLEKRNNKVIVANNGLEAVNILKDFDFDVVLMDIFMPRCNGPQAIRKILEQTPNAKIVILTISEREEDLLQVLRLGAVGYLLKSVRISEIAEALRTAVTGEVALSPIMTARLVAEFRKKSGQPILSSRETEILQLLGEG